jgi:DNA-binding CsgD family transcriptional regulator
MSVNLTQQEWHLKILEQGMEKIGQALLIVTNRGEIEFMSDSAKMLLKNQRGLTVVDKHLVAEMAPDNLRLQNAIESMVDIKNTRDNSISLYVHRDQHPKPYYLTVSRIQKQPEDRRDGHNALILIKDLSVNYQMWTDRLKDEFHLSPREIECVVLLTERRDVHEVAQVMDVCVETVRQYIKSIFKKMDVQKQHELVSLALEYRRNR